MFGKPFSHSQAAGLVFRHEMEKQQTPGNGLKAAVAILGDWKHLHAAAVSNLEVWETAPLLLIDRGLAEVHRRIKSSRGFTAEAAADFPRRGGGLPVYWKPVERKLLAGPLCVAAMGTSERDPFNHGFWLGRIEAEEKEGVVSMSGKRDFKGMMILKWG